MLPIRPDEERPSWQSPAEHEPESDFGQRYSSSSREPAEDWGPFRTALGLVVVGGLLVLGSSTFLFVYAHLPYDPAPSPSNAMGPAGSLLIAAAGLVGMVLMGTGLVQTHGVPGSTGLRSISRACSYALLGTVVAAIFLVYGLVDDSLVPGRRGFDPFKFDRWGPSLSCWLATLLLLSLTMLLWLLLLARVAKHFRRLILVAILYNFIVVSAATMLCCLLLVAVDEFSAAPRLTPGALTTRYTAGFAVEVEYHSSRTSAVGVSIPPRRSPALAWVRALLATSWLVMHQLLVVRVRQACFGASRPTFAMTPPTIPTDWRWDRSQPGD